LRPSLSRAPPFADGTFADAVNQVPGAFELPLAARFLALSGTVDAVVCVGCLVEGGTPHFGVVASAVGSGLMSVGLQTSTPCVFGVLTVHTEAQARERAGLGSGGEGRSGKGEGSNGGENSGLGWGRTAVEMALLRQSALGGGKGPAVSFGTRTPLAAGSGKPAGAPGARPDVKPGIGF
jgi:6,7-dimethyl-8-ribityllumazine synthase